MTSETNMRADAASARPCDIGRADILLVGLPDEDGRAVPPRLFGALAQRTRGVCYDRLEPSQLRKAAAVLSPIVTRDFDAVDLAGRLRDAGFEGQYIVYATEVADEGIIRSEVAEIAPDLAFDVVAMGRGPRLAAR